MNVRIEPLVDHPGLVPEVAAWLYREWAEHSPDGTQNGMLTKLCERLNRERAPIALVALEDGRPLGTASLKLREVEIRPQYEYWLGALYVHPPYRQHGVGAGLVAAVERLAAGWKVDKLYLYTRHERTECWYARLGWRLAERPEYRGRPAAIMVKEPGIGFR